MADDKPEYLVGDAGVQLTATPLHTPDGGLLSAQNCEFIRDFGLGGIGSRAGLARLNASAAAGAILHIQNLPFGYPNALVMMVAMNAGETETWKKTTDGTTYTDIAAGTLGGLVAVDKFDAVFVNGSNLFLPRRTVSYKRRFYFAGNNYTVDTTAPVLVSWDGANAYEIFRLPNNPTQSGTVPRWIIDLWPADGFIYLSTWEFGGVAPDHKGRVIRFDPENGTLTLIGNRFGDGAGENTGGMPYCLTTYLGQVWAGTMGIAGNPNGKVYRINPFADETWTLDQTLGVDEGYLMSMLQYKGNLYLGTSSDASGTAKVKKRTAAGVYSNSRTGPGAGVGYYGGLIEFNGLLFAAYFHDAVSSVIETFDNTNWLTDLNVGTNILTANLTHAPGSPFVFGGALYWPYFDWSNDGALTNFLLKRTAAGVWSKVLTNVGVRGGLGLYRPDAS